MGDEHKLKTARITAWCTPDELQHVKDVAKSLNMSQSEYINFCIFKKSSYIRSTVGHIVKRRKYQGQNNGNHKEENQKENRQNEQKGE
jgi:hypothetical protein